MNPEKIGRYEIKSELGRGGMATVYRAYDPRFEREVALKVLPREFMHDANFRVRFEREAKTIASLEHPAIVPVYDVGEDDNQPYFVMRLMPGGSLSDVISKGPISLREAARIMNRLGPALDEAHAKGIIHRDLKPGNILFDRTNEPYVSDFGIAKIAQSQGSTVTGGAIIGTPAYMSPEQAQGDPLDGRSDIYALGVILYEMLAGAQPYQATTPMAVVVKHITDPIPHILDWNPSLPAGIETIIEKAMAKNPDQRFSTAGEMAIALNALAQGNTAEDALKTAVLSVSNTQASKTRMAGKAEATRLTPGGKPEKKNTSPMSWIVPIAGVAVIGVIALMVVVGALVLPSMFSTTPTATSTDPAITETSPNVTEVSPPTETVEPTTIATPSATETATPTQNIPAPQGIGGADMVAFLANNEVWLVNLDGSNLQQLTDDQDNITKFGLQWMPDGKNLVYIAGKNVFTVDATTKNKDTIMSFGGLTTLDAFRISPDGKQVAISMNSRMYIVPLDLEKLKSARSQSAMDNLKGCIRYTAGTREAAAHVLEFRWAADSKGISWMYTGNDINGTLIYLIHVLDISACDPTKIILKDEFPSSRFATNNKPIIDYDWNGEFQFVLHTYFRNIGWGPLYIYSSESHKGKQIAPIDGKCCYRDARWSPDGSYLFFAFQDERKKPDKVGIELYYVDASLLETGQVFKPIPLPEDFFQQKYSGNSIEFAPHIPKP